MQTFNPQTVSFATNHRIILLPQIFPAICIRLVSPMYINGGMGAEGWLLSFRYKEARM